MTSHIQPEESWRKQLDTLLWQNIDLRPREESHARPMSIGLVDQLENFISQAIAEAILEERRKIVNRIEEEKSKGYEANTILEGLIAELKVGNLIHHQ